MAAAARRAGSATLAGALLLLLLGSPACALRSQDEDWYKVLGVPRTAEPAVIRSAYRKLILKWHPDKNPGKEEETAKQTSRLNNAYEILMNPTERRDFEERFFGAASFRPPPPTEHAAQRGPAAAAHGANGAPAAGARPAAQAPGTGDDSGTEQHEPGQERQSTFDPRKPGSSWRAWRRQAAAARDARNANPGPQTFAEAAWEQAMRSSDAFHSIPNPLEAKHRKSPETAAKRQERQREKADRFEGFRNKQQKRAAMRELRQRARMKEEERRHRRRRAEIAGRLGQDGDATDAAAADPFGAADGGVHASRFSPLDPRTWESPHKLRRSGTRAAADEAEARAPDASRRPSAQFGSGLRQQASRSGSARNAGFKARAPRAGVSAGIPVKNGCFWC